MKINITPEEFPDIVAMFLLEKMLKPEDVIPSNEAFSTLVNALEGKGAKAPLMAYYWETPSSSRANFKRLSPVFEKKTTQTFGINITGRLTEELNEFFFKKKNAGPQAAPIQDIPEPDLEEVDSELVELLKSTITMTVKLVTGKDDPNPEKLSRCINTVLTNLLEEEDERIFGLSGGEGSDGAEGNKGN